MLKHESIPGEILDLVLSKTIVPLLNQEIIDEYADVLKRNRFGFKKQEVDSFIKQIKENSIFLEREQTIEDFIDEDDIVFYEIVMSARHTMDAFLVTGNIKHYPIKNFVVTPKQMIDIVKKNK